MSSAGSASAPWTARSVDWVYRLGEFSLFTISLRLLVREGHFSDLLSVGPEARDRIAPPELPRDLAGYLVRSLPIEEGEPRLRRRDGMIRYCAARYRRHWVRLDGSFEDYLRSFSGKSRSTLQRKVRRFREQSGDAAAWRVFRTPAEIEEFHREARTVSALTYQERLMDAGLPDGPEFLTRLRAAAEEGRVRGYLLYAEGRAIAYLYAPMYQGTGILLYSHLGYDPAYERLSPGTVLQYLALEDMFREGTLRVFDFLEGETQQKQVFGREHALCADVYTLRPTARTMLLVYLRIGTEAFSSAIVRAMDAVGVKRWIKRFIRRGVGPSAKAAP